MSPSSADSCDLPALLKLLTTVEAFPPPHMASPADYCELLAQITALCPLHYFGILTRQIENGPWYYSDKLTATQQPPFSLCSDNIIERLVAINDTDGWYVHPIDSKQQSWLLAQTTADQHGLLHPILLALTQQMRLADATAELNKKTLPQRDHQHNLWRHNISIMTRLIRLVDSLPTTSLFAQLEAALHQLLGINEILLVRVSNRSLEKLYPTKPRLSDAQLLQLCHNQGNATIGHQPGWHAMNLKFQQHYFAHLLIHATRPIEHDEMLFLDFLRDELPLLLELKRTHSKLDDIQTGAFAHQQQQQLANTKATLEKQIKQNHALQRQLQFNVLHEPLTLLPNRAVLIHHLHHAMTHFKRYNSAGFAVLFINIDRFKEINVRFTQQIGDELLRAIGQRLQNNIRENDLITRWGGDEFVIYLDSAASQKDIKPVISRIKDRIAMPFLLQHHKLTITVSLGIAIVSELNTGVTQLLHHANLAMSQAKRNGGDQVLFYSPDCQLQLGISPEASLSTALKEGRIIPYFQPIFQLQEKRLIGVEAMARWIEQDNTLKEAIDFISLAEENDMIIALDLQMLRQTCQQLKQWLPLLAERKFKITVNLSGRHLSSAVQVTELIELLKDEEISPSHFIFEFNEQTLIGTDPATLSSLHLLRAMGTQISLDNFGSGNSSLNTLFHLPIDYIKIDERFIQRMLHAPKDMALIRAMRDMSEDLNYSLIIAGIENQQQLQKLIDLGCQAGLGRYLAPPQSGADITARLQATLAFIKHGP